MDIFKPQVKEQKQPLLVDIREAARLLNVSQRTVWQLASEGKITSVKIGKRGVRYSYKSLQSFAGDTLGEHQE